MLKKIDSIEKMQVCEENLICEKCPCNIYGKCLHPYGLIEAEVGSTVIPSVFNTDPRIVHGRTYKIMDKGDGLVKVALDNSETEWFCSEDFVLVE